MATSAKLRKFKSNVNILDLNEDIFREIFRHLECETVYFTMRQVCRKMKYYADEFMQLRGIFMLVAGPENPTEILYVFKQNNMTISICFKIAEPPYPYPVIDKSSVMKMGLFGAIMSEKIVIGDYFMGYGNKWACNINQFNHKANKWTMVESKDAFNVKPNVNSFCPIGNSKLLLLHHYSNVFTADSIQIIWLNRGDLRNAKNKTTYASNSIDMPSQLKGLKYSTMARVAHDKIMLIGGMCGTRVKLSRASMALGEPNRFLWQGRLTKNEKDVIWEKIDVEVPMVRLWPICFKLKDNLYIAGGKPELSEANRGSYNSETLLCCDRYNLKEGKYYKSVHIFPYPLQSRSVTNIVTDDEESFAIFVLSEMKHCQNKDFELQCRKIIFTEKRGFEEIPNFLAKGSKQGTIGLWHRHYWTPDYYTTRDYGRIMLKLK